MPGISAFWFLGGWCQRRELNPRPRAYESPALPLSYSGNRSAAGNYCEASPLSKLTRGLRSVGADTTPCSPKDASAVFAPKSARKRPLRLNLLGSTRLLEPPSPGFSRIWKPARERAGRPGADTARADQGQNPPGADGPCSSPRR